MVAGWLRSALLGGLVLGVACGPSVQSGLSDAQLTMRVRTAIVNDLQLGTERIDVDVRGGSVALSGRVTTAELVERAEEVVGRVEGVRRVTNSLQVGQPEVDGRARPGRLPSLAPPQGDLPFRVLGLGVAGTLAWTPDDGSGNGASVGPLVRLRPRTGWGPSLGFGWTKSDLRSSPSGAAPLARLAVRPIMGGVQYSLINGRVASSVSLTGGYAFNSLSVDASQAAPGRAIAVGNSLAARAGVSVWIDVSPRVGVNVFGGYRVARPTVTFASDTQVTESRVNADTVMLSVGFAYWVF